MPEEIYEGARMFGDNYEINLADLLVSAGAAHAWPPVPQSALWTCEPRPSSPTPVTKPSCVAVASCPAVITDCQRQQTRHTPPTPLSPPQSSLETLSRAAVANSLSSLALPLLALTEHLASRVTRSLSLTVLSRVLRVRLLCNLGCLAPASLVLVRLIDGAGLPSRSRGGEELMLRGEDGVAVPRPGAALPRYRAALHPAHPSNRPVVLYVATQEVHPSVQGVYGAALLTQLQLARADFLRYGRWVNAHPFLILLLEVYRTACVLRGSHHRQSLSNYRCLSTAFVSPRTCGSVPSLWRLSDPVTGGPKKADDAAPPPEGKPDPKGPPPAPPLEPCAEILQAASRILVDIVKRACKEGTGVVRRGAAGGRGAE